MAAQVTSAEPGKQLGPPVNERTARSISGLPAVVLCLVLIVAGGLLLQRAGSEHGSTATALVWAGIIVLVVASLGFGGLTPVAPGNARVIQLFTGPVLPDRMGVDAAGKVRVPDTRSNRAAELPWFARYR